MHVDPAQLRLLALIDRHGTLSAAADELGLTPAAITGQLTRAETAWQTQLVTRGPRGARLTDAGSVLATSGALIDDLCTDAHRRMLAELPLLTARLRVGTFQSAAQHLLPPALTALRHQNPDVAVTVTEISSDQGPDLVARGSLDIAVVANYGDVFTLPTELTIHPLLEDPIVICLPDDHPLARATKSDQSIRLTQLRDQNWIAIIAGQPARTQFDHAAGRAGLNHTVVMETENYNVAQSLVATGIANALLSRLTITPTPGATHRPLSHPRLARTILAVTRADTRLAPLVTPTLTLLHDVAQDLAQTWKPTDPARP